MKYTDEHVTGWFDVEKQKPWEPGVYEGDFERNEGVVFFSYWNGVSFNSGWITPERALEHAESIHQGDINLKKWRGLSQNPNAKPKRSGNKRKVMYVVMFDEKPVAAFNTAKECKDYVKRGNIWWTSIEKIRFRTPEHN